MDRRRILEDFIAGAKLLYVARRLADDGLKAWAVVQERGYEGMVAKPASTVLSGAGAACTSRVTLLRMAACAVRVSTHQSPV